MAGNTELGAVFYCDGGSRPTSSGYGGYGVHGYTYDMVKEIKGTLEPSKSGKPKPTQYGYVDPKLDFPKDAVLVEPKEYVDELEALGFNVTNNQAELDAAIRAIELGKAKGAKRIQLLSDSQYVVVGATNHLANWRENNWVKSDNKPLMNAERWR
ncbi:RNase H family protein, partial [Escherichia coli]